MFDMGKLSWKSWDEKAKTILQKNQYPPSFYKPIIHKTLSKICKPEVQDEIEENEEEPKKKLIFLQYRGKAT